MLPRDKKKPFVNGQRSISKQATHSKAGQRDLTVYQTSASCNVKRHGKPAKAV